MMTYFMMTISGLATFLLLSLRKKKYDISWFTIIIILVVAGLVGYFGAALSTYLSDGVWPGIRFYGKVLFVTISLCMVSKKMELNCAQIMDYYAPVDIFALVIMKMNCMRFGCCSGIEIHMDDSGCFVFPSQMAELLCAFIIFIVLIGLEYMGKCKHYRYSIYLISYGITRFVFDILREDRGRIFTLSKFDISMAQIFCVTLVCIGLVGMSLTKSKKAGNVNPQSCV